MVAGRFFHRGTGWDLGGAASSGADFFQALAEGGAGDGAARGYKAGGLPLGELPILFFVAGGGHGERNTS